MTHTPAKPDMARGDRGSRCFTPAMRLRRRTDFAAVFADGERHAAGPLMVLGRPNDGSSCRLGLAVSRKVGRAVRRNRIKRLIREAFRLNHSSMPKAYDVVVIVRPHEPLPLSEYEVLIVRAIRHLDEKWTTRRNRAT